MVPTSLHFTKTTKIEIRGGFHKPPDENQEIEGDMGICGVDVFLMR